MSRYIAILIDGDNENTLGGACSRDVWNITKKIISDINIDKKDIHTFFHNMANDRYIEKLLQLGVHNISQNSLCNIKKCFDEIITISKSEKIVVFFHYSGHGYQIQDDNGDEIDGCDEIFLGHTMRDDYIWDNLISRLPKTAHIFALMDACHSGSGTDMPYVWRNGHWVINKKKNINAECSGFSISACNDSQCASQDIGETTGFSGSLTAGVCDTCDFKELIHNPLQTYIALIPRLQKLNQNTELYSVKCPV